MQYLLPSQQYSGFLVKYQIFVPSKGPINVKNISFNVRDINVDAVPQYASFLSKNDIKGIYGKYWIKKYLDAEFKFMATFLLKLMEQQGKAFYH